MKNRLFVSLFVSLSITLMTLFTYASDVYAASNDRHRRIPVPTPTPPPVTENFTANAYGTAIDLYGDINPLNQDRLNTLISSLNATASPMNENTYYGTIFVVESVYQKFLTDTRENLVTYIKRQADALEGLMHNARLPVNSDLRIRRIIIVTDATVTTPSSYHEGYLTNRINDSDGTWYFDSPYTPTESSYYDSSASVDYGLLHEWGHAILHLNDQYNLDVPESAIAQTLLTIIPQQWHTYTNFMKLDVSDCDLMATVGPCIQQFTALQLNRRTNIHNFTKVLADYVGWNMEFPTTVQVSFTQEGKPISIQSISIYRMTEPDAVVAKQSRRTSVRRRPESRALRTIIQTISGNARISETPIRTITPKNGEHLSINPSNLFRTDVDGIIPYDEGTLLFIVTDTASKMHFRWMDVRDFNVAKWTGMNALTIATGDDAISPQLLSWVISYGSGRIAQKR